MGRFAAGSRVGGSIVVQNVAGVILVLEPAPGVGPSTWNPASDAAQVHGLPPPSATPAPRATIRPAGSGWPFTNPAKLSATRNDTIVPAGGSSGVVRESFGDVVPWDNYPATSVDFCGSSSAKWLGLHPFNASKIDLINDWHVDGIIISVSYPPGFSFSSSDVTDTVTVANTWAVYEDYATCPIHFGGILYGASHSVTGRYYFGNHSYLRGPASDGATV